jgi:hypothetical protein
MLKTYVYDPSHECPRRKNDIGRFKDLSLAGKHAIAYTARGENLFYLILNDIKVFLRRKTVSHVNIIKFAVYLGPGRPCRIPLGRVQHPELYSAGVRGLGHFAAQRVYLLDKLSFADTAYGRITRGVPYGILFHGYKKSADFHPRTGQRRFASRVASSHHYNVVSFHHHLPRS